MRLLSTYERIKCADVRCREIVQELKELPSIEYCPQETRGLNQEYLWSAQFIINQCQYILDSESDDTYGEEVDFRIKLSYFQECYEQKLEKINNYNEE
jgi:hypothetical protein